VGNEFFWQPAAFPAPFRSRTPGPPPFSAMNSMPAPSRARRLVADGEGPAVYRLGRRWFVIDPADLETWVASRRINTPTPEASHAL